MYTVFHHQIRLSSTTSPPSAVMKWLSFLSDPSSVGTVMATAFLKQMWLYINIYLSYLWLLVLHQMRLCWRLPSFIRWVCAAWLLLYFLPHLSSDVTSSSTSPTSDFSYFIRWDCDGVCLPSFIRWDYDGTWLPPSDVAFIKLLLLLLWWMPVFIRWVHHQPCLLHRWWMTSSSVMATDFLLFYFHPPLVVFQMIEIQNGGSERELSLLIRIPPASMMPDLRSFRHKSLANLSSSLHPSVLKNWLLHQLTLWWRLTSESHHT